MTNAFTIPAKSFVLSSPKARLTFVSKTRARPKTMNSIVLPGSSKELKPKLMRSQNENQNS
jgi:hypothetical protein